MMTIGYKPTKAQPWATGENDAPVIPVERKRDPNVPWPGLWIEPHLLHGHLVMDTAQVWAARDGMWWKVQLTHVDAPDTFEGRIVDTLVMTPGHKLTWRELVKIRWQTSELRRKVERWRRSRRHGEDD